MKASDRIATMVHAFDSASHKREVRAVVERVKRLESVVAAARVAVVGLDEITTCCECRWCDLLRALAALDAKDSE